MSRRVLRSWKCKAGAHQGTPKTLVVPSGRLPSSQEDTVLRETAGAGEYVGVLTIIAAQCRWHGCRCYCHPWFVKRPGLRRSVDESSLVAWGAHLLAQEKRTT